VGYKSSGFFPVTLIAVSVSFVFRVVAVKEHWQQIVPYVAPAQGPKIGRSAAV
jgi:hypothetical protein